MDDANLILRVFPISDKAVDILKDSHNQTRYVEEVSRAALPDYSSRETTPDIADVPEEDVNDKRHLELRLDRPPRNKVHYVFGSNPKSCDILVGSKVDGVSDEHFRISFDKREYVTLTDTSKNGTFVTYEGRRETLRRKFTWILFPNSVIGVRISRDISFQIILGQHGARSERYRSNVTKFMKSGCAEMGLSSVEALVARFEIQNREITAAHVLPDALLDEDIYHYDEESILGTSNFSTVYRAVNVSSGRVYAAKRYHLSGSHVSEVLVFKTIKPHVCPTNVPTICIYLTKLSYIAIDSEVHRLRRTRSPSTSYHGVSSPRQSSRSESGQNP